jgi:hypothetical protein
MKALLSELDITNTKSNTINRWHRKREADIDHDEAKLLSHSLIMRSIEFKEKLDCQLRRIRKPNKNHLSDDSKPVCLPSSFLLPNSGIGVCFILLR